MEQWQRDLRDDLQSVHQAQTAATTRELVRQQKAQAASQNELLGEILFEQQISGLPSSEKQRRRGERQSALAKAKIESLEAETRENAMWAVFGIVCIIGFFCFVWALVASSNSAEQEGKRRFEQMEAETKRRIAENERREQAARHEAEIKWQQQVEKKKREKEEAKVASVQAAKEKVEAAQVRAALFHLQRASNGSAGSQLDLGRRYLIGNGLPVDKELAVYWFKAAAAQGEKAAEVELRKLAP